MSETANSAAKATRRPNAFLGWLRSIPIRSWIALVIVIVALVFVLQNRHDASIYLFNATVTAPLWTTLLVTLVVGIVIGLLVRGRHRNRRAARSG